MRRATLTMALGQPLGPGLEAKTALSSSNGTRALDVFLAGVEKRAFQTARRSTGDREDALEIVQDCMLKFAVKYARKDSAEWPLLFQRILHNRIVDHHRRRSVRERIMRWLPRQEADAEEEADPILLAADPAGVAVDEQLQQRQAIERLEQVLPTLPLRQRQAFSLRVGEELNVAETAFVMGCSQASVKTHLWRALERLREELGEFWSG